MKTLFQDTIAAQKIRWNTFVLYLLKLRYNEITKLKDGLEKRKDLNDPTYISMIKDIHEDQLELISDCRSLFIKEGFDQLTGLFEVQASALKGYQTTV